MNLEEFRTVFATGSLILILVAAAPAVGLFLSFPDGGEQFSELWLLGPTRMAEDYPFNVTTLEEKQVFVGIGNHIGRSAYYAVYAKFRNQTQLPPNSTTATPSSLAQLYEFRVVVADDETVEMPVFFSFVETSRSNDSFSVERISINDAVFPVDTALVWDEESVGFFCQLFFELWIFDEVSSSFQYHNRYVGLWLNMTG